MQTSHSYYLKYTQNIVRKMFFYHFILFYFTLDKNTRHHPDFGFWILLQVSFLSLIFFHLFITASINNRFLFILYLFYIFLKSIYSFISFKSHHSTAEEVENRKKAATTIFVVF